MYKVGIGSKQQTLRVRKREGEAGVTPCYWVLSLQTVIESSTG